MADFIQLLLVKNTLVPQTVCFLIQFLLIVLENHRLNSLSRFLRIIVFKDFQKIQLSRCKGMMRFSAPPCQDRFFSHWGSLFHRRILLFLHNS